MRMQETIKNLFTESIQTQIAATESLSSLIEQASEQLVNTLLAGNKIIVCGHERAYSIAQIFVSNLLNRYHIARPSFPSVLLSLEGGLGATLVKESHSEELYIRQFNSVAQKGDLLVVFLTTGNEEAVLHVLSCATSKELHILALTGSGNNNDHLRGLLQEEDLEISVPSAKPARILEGHLFIINTLSEMIDTLLFSHLE